MIVDVVCKNYVHAGWKVILQSCLHVLFLVTFVHQHMEHTQVSHKYTECQKKLLTSSERHSLKSTPSKLIIFGHRSALILLNKNIWENRGLIVSKRRKMQWNYKRSFFENHRNCSPSELHVGSLFRTFNSYSLNVNGRLCNHCTSFCLWGTPSPGGEYFLQCLKNDLLRYHHIFLLFDSSKPLFFLDVLNQNNYS